MKIVLDSNRVLAAMIKDSTTREILFDTFFEFIAPDFILTEIRENEGKIIKTANITKGEFEILLALIFEHITIIPETEYDKFVKSIKDEITDAEDISYIAVCLASDAHGIWTHDSHFDKQDKVKVFTNISMLELSGKAKSE